eukprot:scaffold63924_cov26-Tisochrysis_lutea.AAC.1
MSVAASERLAATAPKENPSLQCPLRRSRHFRHSHPVRRSAKGMLNTQRGHARDIRAHKRLST